jgi:hypothetical protein
MPLAIRFRVHRQNIKEGSRFALILPLTVLAFVFGTKGVLGPHPATGFKECFYCLNSFGKRNGL